MTALTFADRLYNTLNEFDDRDKTIMMDSYGFNDMDEETREEFLKKFPDLKYECVKSWGGEDEGTDYGAVWKFMNEDGDVAYIKFWGNYYSYDGAYFETMCIVQPVEKTVIFYE